MVRFDGTRALIPHSITSCSSSVRATLLWQYQTSSNSGAFPPLPPPYTARVEDIPVVLLPASVNFWRGGLKGAHASSQGLGMDFWDQNWLRSPPWQLAIAKAVLQLCLDLHVGFIQQIEEQHPSESHRCQNRDKFGVFLH
jgi:hypothetical protein